MNCTWQSCGERTGWHQPVTEAPCPLLRVLCRFSLTLLPFIPHNLWFRPTHPTASRHRQWCPGGTEGSVSCCCSPALCKPALSLHGQRAGGVLEKLHQQNQGHSPKAQPNAVSPFCIFRYFYKQVFDCACFFPSLSLKAQFRGNKPMIFPGKIKTVVPFN